MFGDALRGVGRLRMLRPFHQAWYESRFASATGPVRLFRGIYPTFDAAIASAPSGRPIGFDNASTAGRMAHDRHGIYASDYPVLYWLARLMPDVHLLFDLGGNVGVSYLGYRPYLTYHEELRWLVHDVPAVVALGERIVQEEGGDTSSGHLQFTTLFDELPTADLVLAAASLQFLDDPMEWLRSATRRPRWVLINKTPLTEQPSAVTLHAIGPSYCAYHLLNRGEFVQTFEHLGYRTIDRWSNADIGCEIPFHPEYRISAYTGMLFELVGRDSAHVANGSPLARAADV